MVLNDKDGSLATQLMQATLAENKTFLQSFTTHEQMRMIPSFDGKSPPLSRYFKDLERLEADIPEEYKSKFLTAVISKLRGKAREIIDNVS